MKIALIGASGNIGAQVCDVVRKNPALFTFSALVAGSDKECIERLSNEFHPAYAGLANGEKAVLPQGTVCLCKEELIPRAFEDCDVAFIAAGGFAGLAYTLNAAQMGKVVALANKESLVCGGELVEAALKKSGATLIPVDSEHSALFQALSFSRETPFRKLILTASGGPFYKLSEKQLENVTAKDALRHPTWSMGAKITVDSATLLNKGYEIIEAKWLYHTEFSKIEAIVHPESIVHSMVEFTDGAVMAQLSYPDMRLPIQLALTYPNRLPCTKSLDFTALSALHFERLPQEKFPCFTLALEAGKAGGIAPTLLNGAGEVAVHAFLNGGISFPRIAETISWVLNKIPNEEIQHFTQLKEADALARREAETFIYGK